MAVEPVASGSQLRQTSMKSFCAGYEDFGRIHIGSRPGGVRAIMVGKTKWKSLELPMARKIIIKRVSHPSLE